MISHRDVSSSVQPILFVLSGFTPSSAGSQALLAAHVLIAGGQDVHVAGWDSDGCLAADFATAGATVHELGPSRILQVERLRRLRDAFCAVRPRRTIAWGLPAIRLTAVLPRRDVGVWLAAHAFPFEYSFAGRLRDIWALRRAGRVLVSTRAEQVAAVEFGIPAAELMMLAPSVDESNAELQNAIVPAHGRYLLSVGPLERTKGIQDSIWAMEILKFLFEDLRLLIAGAGPDLARLLAFVHAIKSGESVQFLGIQPSLSRLYAGAGAVWIPSHADRGVQVALEAMRAGRPVVASRLPRLAEIVVEGETGFLVPVGDKVALAKQTRKLFDNPQLAERMGQAGRQRVVEHFSRAPFQARLLELLR